ncbi:hypothetical protein B296_00041552 [Ensete ventricosum]|uniref:Uncharacterized protein n=1 Tax=Ensete ventricosum TaxID=4639 RepID=A0A426ZLF8_ENSVE|nr:hypothetical protein B296_00041552 [Ensete ventricosum]
MQSGRRSPGSPGVPCHPQRSEPVTAGTLCPLLLPCAIVQMISTEYTSNDIPFAHLLLLLEPSVGHSEDPPNMTNRSPRRCIDVAGRKLQSILGE